MTDVTKVDNLKCLRHLINDQYVFSLDLCNLKYSGCHFLLFKNIEGALGYSPFIERSVPRKPNQ
jgi:hypothetical protein